jgi:hypothetical protein
MSESNTANSELNRQFSNKKITECSEFKTIPFKGIEDHEKWRAFTSLLHGSAQLYTFLILFGQNLESRGEQN